MRLRRERVSFSDSSPVAELGRWSVCPGINPGVTQVHTWLAGRRQYFNNHTPHHLINPGQADTLGQIFEGSIKRN